MKRSLLWLFPSAFFLSACGPPAPTTPDSPAEAAPVAGIVMDAETQARMGVRTAKLAPANVASTAEGFARVLDVAPSVVLRELES